jgi:hypothetical protein
MLQISSHIGSSIWGKTWNVPQNILTATGRVTARVDSVTFTMVKCHCTDVKWLLIYSAPHQQDIVLQVWCSCMDPGLDTSNRSQYINKWREFEMKKCMYKVVLMRIHVTIATVEKQYVLHIISVCVCLALIIRHAKCMRRIILCDLSHSTIFLSII